MQQLTPNQVFCRMAEYDLACNLDKGQEYTGFKKLYTDSMLKKGYVSNYGHLYDISDYRASEHILNFLERLKQEVNPEVIMTSGTFFSMNIKLQKKVVKCLIELSKKGSVKLYIGINAMNLFINTGVQVIVAGIDRMRTIPHFITTNLQFNCVLPHTEKKLVRVDINSDNLDSNARQLIIIYFKSLVAELDTAIIGDNIKVD